jgi:hypothetical protein
MAGQVDAEEAEPQRIGCVLSGRCSTMRDDSGRMEHASAEIAVRMSESGLAADATRVYWTNEALGGGTVMWVAKP